ncbi:MAG: 3-deoxy-manno-octulosonate cytidylyltransferase [bacterium]
MKIAVLGVIPARYASSRLPGKPLAMIAGKPMIQHVYERASQTKTLGKLVVATDDERILKTVLSFGGQAKMTRPNHPSGSDRVAEVAEHENYDIVVNIQGDEPFLSPNAIDTAVEKLLSTPDAVASTLVAVFPDVATLQSPNTAKVVLARDDFAIYFSRAPIPYNRDQQEIFDRNLREGYYQHVGLYAYRSDFLQEFVNLPVCDIERVEKLEQLRILKYGYKIVCARVNEHSFCVDTPEDLQKAQFLAKEYAFGV